MRSPWGEIRLLEVWESWLIDGIGIWSAGVVELGDVRVLELVVSLTDH